VELLKHADEITTWYLYFHTYSMLQSYCLKQKMTSKVICVWIFIRNKQSCIYNVFFVLDQHINSAFLTFVIYSIDSWGKERVEGYTSHQIPKFHRLINYNKNIKLEAWLPKSRKCVDSLHRYFIGGSVKLAEPNYVCVPKNFNVNIKYYFKCFIFIYYLYV